MNLLKIAIQGLKSLTAHVLHVLQGLWMLCIICISKKGRNKFVNNLKEQVNKELQDEEDLKARKTVVNETLENNLLEDLDGFYVNASGQLTSNDEHWTGGGMDGVIPYKQGYYNQDGTLEQEVEYLFFFSYGTNDDQESFED